MSLAHGAWRFSIRGQRMSQRRARIVDAARELIVAAGSDGFSMKLLADRSGVSLMTIYNLIGQKQDVLRCVFEGDLLNFYKAVASIDDTDPFRMLTEYVAFAIRTLFDEERYYRVLFSLFFSPSGHELMQLFRQPHKHFWVKIINRAIETGLLVETTDSVQISHIFDDITRSAHVAWLWRTLDEAQMRNVICYRFAIILSGLATDAGAAKLGPMIAEFAAIRTRHRDAQRFVMRPRRRRQVN